MAWLEDLPEKGQAQVDARLNRIQEHGYFGDARHLGDGLAELKWKNGWRVYFARIEWGGGDTVLLVLGGNKNGQEKDIRKAKLLLRKHAQNAP
jgi:putative addiction module killer protein